MSDRPFQQFLAIAHQRNTFACIGRHFRRCMAVGAGMALLLSVIVWSLGNSAVVWAVAILIIAGISGLFLGWYQRPTHLATAIAIDARLGLHDLLSTAAQLCLTDAGPWHAAIFSMADERCRRLSAKSLFHDRQGARHWGIIALTIAMTAAIGTLSETKAHHSIPPSVAMTTQGTDDLGVPQADQRSVAYVGHHSPRKASEDLDSPHGPDESTDIQTQPDTRLTPSSDASANAGHSANPDGAGGGAGTSKAQSSAKPPPRATATGNLSNDAQRAGSVAAGGQDTNEPITDSRKSPGGGVASAGAAKPMAPWNLDSWKIDADRAVSQTRQSANYSAYGDVVRAYFDR